MMILELLILTLSIVGIAAQTITVASKPSLFPSHQLKLIPSLRSHSRPRQSGRQIQEVGLYLQAVGADS